MAKKATIKKKNNTRLTNGRSRGGLFAKGNQIGAGRSDSTAISHAKKLKQVLLDAVTPEDMMDIAKTLVKQAKAGDTACIKELFDRCFGKPHQTHDVAVETQAYSQAECDDIRSILAQRCN